MRAFLNFFCRICFRLTGHNTSVLNAPGPVLLIPNHVSWLDWLFLVLFLDDTWRFVTSSVTAQTSWLHRMLMLNKHCFPIDTNSPYAVKRMAEYLQTGGRLVLFAEGRLSRTGSLMKLFDGTGFLLFKTHAKVITAYIRGARRLPFSPNRDEKTLFPRISVHFSEVLSPPPREFERTIQARAFFTSWLRDRMVEQRFETEMQFGRQNLFDAIAETAAAHPSRTVLEDASLQQLTYRKLMIGAELMGQRLGVRLSPNATRIGVLLPNVNGMVVTLLALWRIRRVPAVLNFSTGPVVMLTCTELAGLKQIITSRLFLQRAKLNIDSLVGAGIEFIYLEDVRAEISDGDKFAAMLRHTLLASTFTTNIPPNDTAVILFTSGSEGVPKGVELTHRNILANIRQMLSVTDLDDKDRIFNCLPMFHSFGLSVGTILPLVRGMYVFVYPSPLHYRVVPSALYERDCTVFLSTNTFLNGYARKAHPYDFRSMRYLFAAAEKLQESTATTWAQKYGVRILEGYGATECAPCVSVNTPLIPRYGSVGRIMPGMEYRIEPIPGVDEGGELFVKGPNVMKGYLNPDANAKFLKLDGWYDTGDIVSVDAEGFFHVRGRLKRFAKVSGEMVSLTAVEDALAGAFPQFGMRCQTAIVTRHDEDKGEALIAVTNEPKLTLDDIRQAIKAKGLSNLSVPREIKYVREIPKLGTGKVNHRELSKIIADESAAPAKP